ncbi:MAG TPA: polyprenyl diphosphate synthase, partial [Candidatus Paceibacterota bacterium]|nr:polyprenyl diphosphate synthase [Candidatus Paceibacterota bacterium]
EAFHRLGERAKREGVIMRFIGQRERMPEDLQACIRASEEDTKGGSEGVLTIALSYGGRAEIVAAVNRLLAEGADAVDEERFAAALWSAGTSDPDLIIRTGGDQRLSNFLTWQSVYSELFFLDTPFPALARQEFDAVLVEFAARERRRGK